MHGHRSPQACSARFMTGNGYYYLEGSVRRAIGPTLVELASRRQCTWAATRCAASLSAQVGETAISAEIDLAAPQIPQRTL
jgi:hypothetical protein